jgi:ABC-type transporter Mla MlaB component
MSTRWPPGGDEFPRLRRSLQDMAAPPPTVAFAIRSPIERAELLGLYDRACALLEGATGAVVVCDVEGAAADAVTIDALARLGLAARRHGYQVRLRGTSAELRDLLEFVGLADVLLPREGADRRGR